MLKPLTVKITTNCGKLLKMWEYRNTYLSPENPVRRSRSKLVRTGHGTRDWFKIGKRVHQGCILSPCIFNLYTEYIMGNAWLNEYQTGIKIARRNNSNLSYADNTTLMAEGEEELKSLLMKVKEEREKVGLKLNFQKPKIMVSSPITSWQIEGKNGSSNRLYFLGLQDHSGR